VDQLAQFHGKMTTEEILNSDTLPFPLAGGGSIYHQLGRTISREEIDRQFRDQRFSVVLGTISGVAAILIGLYCLMASF